MVFLHNACAKVLQNGYSPSKAQYTTIWSKNAKLLLYDTFSI